ncbi:hypothetical protein DXN05_10190 [Deminuibacter soli]|uniref:Uncharacterized protein n=2 Tax=Deminuibacter soli TaxID=2291815 RepID=A0A3E1NMH5_9BACT|nr:hypothetical protein DXN05_10190 [Deminuibacter soli]
MIDAALGDYQSIYQSASITLELLHAVDTFYTRKQISTIIKQSDPGDFSNDYLITVCEFGAMLGHLFCQQGGFGWLYSHPYFNSIIVHEATGTAIPVFDWANKKFSEYGVDDGFAAKFKMALDHVNKNT